MQGGLDELSIGPNVLKPDQNGEISRWGMTALFCAAYVALDWASYIDALHQLNITPWNPAPALGILFLLRRGAGGGVSLFVALATSDLLVRQLPSAIALTLFLNGILTLGYVAMATMLRRHVAEGGMFVDRTSLVIWSAIIFLGSLLNSLLFITAHTALGLLPTTGWTDAVLRFWVGDSVGIFVTLPLLWWLQDSRRRLSFQSAVMRWETFGYVTLLLASLWFAFVPGAASHFRYFYILFLPLVWAASRQGIAGAVFCVSLLQIGMLLAGWLWDAQAVSIFELQMRSLLLAIVGFLIGVAVDEQRRAAADLRHTLRLASAGEMAAALAHELNQPLTALVAYGSASEHILQRDGGSEQLRDVIRRMVRESGRAAEVVRRLRDFFRTGSTQLERFPLQDLIGACLQPFSEKAADAGVEVVRGAMPAVTLHADRLQIEVVMRNLLANAFDAVSTNIEGQRRVTVLAEIHGGNQLHIRVEDNGPGLAPDMLQRVFEPFVSTKSSGLGLGLAISRSIAEAHGGSLVVEEGSRGRFMLILPFEPH